MDLTTDELLDAGINAHSQGNLEDAQRLYKLVLKSQPLNPDANHNLGLIAMSANQANEALAFFKIALKANPKIEQFWLSYIEALAKNGLKKEGKKVAAKAKKRGFDREKLKASLSGLGNYDGSEVPRKKIDKLLSLFRSHQFSDAEELARSLAHIYPSYPLAWKVLGAIQAQTGRLSEAITSSQKALKLSPFDAEIHNNLGNSLQEIGKPLQAEKSLKKAIALKPDFAGAHGNLGNTLKELGKLEEAEASYQRAISLDPNFKEPHFNLGNLFKEMGRLEEARESYSRALNIKEDFVEAHCNLGATLQELGLLSEAESEYRLALRLKSNFTEAYSNLLFMNAATGLNAIKYLKDAKVFSEKVAADVGSPFRKWLSHKDVQKLRVGFISGDLKAHPVGFFIEGLLKKLRSTNITLFAYPTNNPRDDISKKLRRLFHYWSPLQGVSDEDAARRIHNDGINILFDLSGHTKGNRLPIFAWKPAPIQISWLGYFASTGLAEIDYILGDPFVTPSNESHHFTERVWQLPESYLCFTVPDLGQDVAPLPALTNGFITFGCFNKLAKMTEEVVSVRAEILRLVPNSKLFLKDRQLNYMSARDRVLSAFAAHGIHKDRLIFEGKSSREEYLACFSKVDIALSPFPYGGGTTTVEGLWMGTPAITRKGGDFLSHLGESIAQNTSLTNWIAADNDEYIAKAVDFSSNLKALGELRDTMREHLAGTPLFDIQRFSKHFERALWEMWDLTEN